MMNRNEVLAWVNSLGVDDSIGIDEGGLCLRQVLPDDTIGEAYCEVGGIPEEIENGHLLSCGHRQAGNPVKMPYMSRIGLFCDECNAWTALCEEEA